MSSKMSLSEYSPELAAQWHSILNGELNPDSVTYGSTTKVWWLGPCEHEWEARVANRTLSKSGCPFCAKTNRRALAGIDDLAALRPDVADQWHPTKNGKLLPEEVTAQSGKKVWWLCEKGHEWATTIESRTRYNHGCPYCAGKKVWQGFNDLVTQRPDLASQWHPTKNGKLTPDEVTAKSGKKVWWQGHCGHEWAATVASRANGNGCPVCANKKVLQGFNDLATANTTLAAQWHPTKNGNLTPNQITKGTHKKVWWLCPECGHEWEDSVISRTKATGCTRCGAKMD